jgi:hypothetical protein
MTNCNKKTAPNGSEIFSKKLQIVNVLLGKTLGEISRVGRFFCSFRIDGIFYVAILCLQWWAESTPANYGMSNPSLHFCQLESV